jgi:hypothetical protein
MFLSLIARWSQSDAVAEDYSHPTSTGDDWFYERALI